MPSGSLKYTITFSALQVSTVENPLITTMQTCLSYEKQKGGCKFSVKSENRVCPRTTSRCASHAFLFIGTPDRRHQIYRNFVSKQCSQSKKRAMSEPMFLSKFFVSNSVDFQIVSKLHLCKWLQYNFWQPQTSYMDWFDRVVNWQLSPSFVSIYGL